MPYHQWSKYIYIHTAGVYKANFNLDRSSVLTGYCDYIVLLGQI